MTAMKQPQQEATTMTEKNEKQEAKVVPLSTQIALRGIRTDGDFAEVFTALIGDSLSGAINPNVCNATCNAAGKLLKMFELSRKYGSVAGSIRLDGSTTPQAPDHGARALALAKLTPEERKALGL